MRAFASQQYLVAGFPLMVAPAKPSASGSSLRVMDLRNDDITGYAIRFAPPNDACSVGAVGKQPASVSNNRRIGDEPADAVHDLQEQ